MAFLFGTWSPSRISPACQSAYIIPTKLYIQLTLVEIAKLSLYSSTHSARYTCVTMALLKNAVLLGMTALAVASTKPNFVFIMTDDQDLHLSSLDYMPLVNKHLVSEGTTFSKHYCTVSLCCPSRVSLLTGKAAHNTNVTSVNLPYGGYQQFVNNGLHEAYLPVWLQQSGYNTYYTGKLMNGFSLSNYNKPYPAGWNDTDCE